MVILLAFAFIAGFITIFSPCILAIAPILLAAGTDQSRYKPLGIITGIIISFSFFTLALSAIVDATHVSPDIFRYAALTITIFFGLTMIIPSLNALFIRLTGRLTGIGNTIEQQSTQIKTQFFSGVLLGSALGLIWTPCAGPILGTITTLAATGGITVTSILITLFYSMGATIPMLALCFGGRKIMQSTKAIAPYTENIQKTFGFIIILSAFAIIFHVDTLIEEKIAHLFPTITFENSSRLQKELEMLKKTNTGLPQSTSQEKQAPELVGIPEWINSPPLTLGQLRGTVVLIDFWTYSCINCIRTLPYVTQWYNDYKKHGFEVIGVHTPEFAFEKNKEHVKDAIKRFNISYPVALDNNYKTWQAYDNHYWPAHYLINQNGVIVKTHFGEGDYKEMENAIRALLNLPPNNKTDALSTPKPLTPETYLGFERADKYHPSLQIQKNSPAIYQHVEKLDNDQIGLTGAWIVAPDCAQSQDDNSTLELNFIATHVYIVMQSDNPQLVNILLDHKPLVHQYYTRDMNEKGEILVHKPRIYELINLNNDYGRHTLTMQCNKGLNAYVFTFGN